MKLKRSLGLVLTLALLMPMLAVCLTLPATAATTGIPAAPAVPTTTELGAIGLTGTVDMSVAPDSSTQPLSDADGDGYIDINTAEELYWVLYTANTAEIPATDKYELCHSFDLKGVNFASLAATGTFAGVLEGNGNAIFNLTVGTQTATKYVFATVTGTLQNIDIVGLYLGNGNNYGGTIAMIKTLDGGTLDGIRVLSSTVHVMNGAGLVYSSKNGAKFSNCLYNGTITHIQNQGYMAAYALYAIDTTFENSVSYATLKTNGGPVQGAAAFAATSPSTSDANADHYLTFTNLINYGNIQSGSGRNGGIAGHIELGASTITFDNCVNYGTISQNGGTNWGGASGNTGGIVGTLQPPSNKYEYEYVTLRDCKNYGDVVCTGGSKTLYLGGLVGQSLHPLVLENCYNWGNVTYEGTVQTVAIGGLVGYSVSNCTWSKNNSGLRATNCGMYGNVTGTLAAGIIGYCASSTMSDLRGVALDNVVMTGEIAGTTATAGVVGQVKAFTHQSYTVPTTFEISLNNCAIRGNLAHTVASTVPVYITVSDNVYLDKTGTLFPNAYTDSDGNTFDVGEKVGNYSDVVGDIAVASSLVDAVNASNGDYTKWYADNANIPTPVTNLAFTGSTVDISHGGALRMLVRLSGYNYLPHGVVTAKQEDTLLTPKDMGDYMVYETVVRPMDAMVAKTYTLETAGEAFHSRKIALVDILAGIYAANSAKDNKAQENALLASIVNYAYYSGSDSVIDTFNTKTGATLAAGVGDTAIPQGGTFNLNAGYSVALSLEDGFVITVIPESGNAYNVKVVFTDDVMRDIDLGAAGTVSVAGMLAKYEAQGYGDQAKAVMMFHTALLEAMASKA